MTASLRDVLTAFEEVREPCSLHQMARNLDMSPGMLEGMIEYWIRKGRLRESGGTPTACAACHTDHCPFIATMPRRYELVTGRDDPDDDAPPPCACCS
jgi:hypothetical protein